MSLQALEKLNQKLNYPQPSWLVELQQLLYGYQHCASSHPGLDKQATATQDADSGLQSTELQLAVVEARLNIQQQLLKDRLWQRHAKLMPLRSLINDYSYYSFHAIQAAAYLYLPAIEAHLTKVSCRQGSIKLNIKGRWRYQDYLNQSYKILEREKQKLASAYYHRVVVLAKTGLCDVLDFVASQFYNQGEKQLKIPVIPQAKPKRAEFRSAISFIYQYGSSTQIKRLKDFSWPTDKTHALIVRDDYILKIPQALCPLIPKTPGYWWQKGTRLRYRMAKQLDQIGHHIQATLRSSMSASDRFLNNTIPIRLEQLDDLQQQLANHVDLFKRQQPKGLFARWFRQKTQHTTDKAIDYLSDRQARLASRQLQMLNKLVENSQYTIELGNETNNTPLKHEVLANLLAKVTGIIKTLPNNRSLQIQLGLVESQFNAAYLLKEQSLQCINPLADSPIVYRLPSIKREFEGGLNERANRYAFYGASIVKQPGCAIDKIQASPVKFFISTKCQQIFTGKRLGLGNHPQI
jgi:hypothetical protein